MQARAANPIKLHPVTPKEGWSEVQESRTEWRPELLAPAAELDQTFERGAQSVTLYVAFYRNQSEDSKAITSRNQLVRTTNKQWRKAASDTISVEVDGRPFTTRTAVVAGKEQRLAVWQWYWVDGYITTSDYVAKSLQAVAMLRGHSDPVAWVVIYTATEMDEAQARGTLKSFAHDMRAPIEAMLQRAARE